MLRSQSGAVVWGEGKDPLGDGAGAQTTGPQGWLAVRDGQGKKGRTAGLSGHFSMVLEALSQHPGSHASAQVSHS